jgi:ABC-2 type transport system ATP-binding protein
MTVRENLRYFAAVLSVGEARIDAVLDEVDMRPQASKLASRLSVGQLSRVSLAVALLGGARLLVLDEPTVGLDPVLRRDLWDLFHRLVKGGTTMLVSSHVMDEAARCDRLLLMRDGRVMADDTPAGLRERMGASDLEQAFLRMIEQAQEVRS